MMTEYELGQFDKYMGYDHEAGRGEEYDKGFGRGYSDEAELDHKTEVQDDRS